MTRIAFLRHGRTDWNREGRIQGRTDRPLDADGRSEVAALRPPDEWARAALVSSPLARARETATLVFGRPPETDERLLEMDWGAWEGARGVDLEAAAAPGFRPITEWGWAFQPPNGEALSALRDRVADWMRAIQEPTVAVAHIGVMRVALALATGWDFRGPAPFRIKRGRLYPIVLDDDGAPLRAETPARLPLRHD